MKNKQSNKGIKDPGYGHLFNEHSDPMVDSNGVYNVLHLNRKFRFKDAYTRLLKGSWSHLLLVSLLAYIIVNLIFASLYLLIGLEELGIEQKGFLSDFWNCFYFSTQTLTTVGFGHLSPQGHLSSILAGLEAFVGLFSFSMITGLVYAKFSRPQSNIIFSKNILWRSFKGKKAIMFRLMNDDKSPMMDLEMTFLLILNRKETKSFHTLKLERKEIQVLPLSWTLVHIIDQESPLYGIDLRAESDFRIEFIATLKYYDEDFFTQLYQSHGYLQKDLLKDQEFVRNFDYTAEGKLYIDHKMLNNTQKIEV